MGLLRPVIWVGECQLLGENRPEPSGTTLVQWCVLCELHSGPLHAITALHGARYFGNCWVSLEAQPWIQAVEFGCRGRGGSVCHKPAPESKNVLRGGGGQRQGARVRAESGRASTHYARQAASGLRLDIHAVVSGWRP